MFYLWFYCMLDVIFVVLLYARCFIVCLFYLWFYYLWFYCMLDVLLYARCFICGFIVC